MPVPSQPKWCGYGSRNTGKNRDTYSIIKTGYWNYDVFRKPSNTLRNFHCWWRLRIYKMGNYRQILSFFSNIIKGHKLVHLLIRVISLHFRIMCKLFFLEISYAHIATWVEHQSYTRRRIWIGFACWWFILTFELNWNLKHVYGLKG
jgi:hypothetical protein